MSEFNTLTVLVGIMFGAIIGLYIWTFKTVGKIYEAIKVEYVHKDVCDIVHTNLSMDITEIKSDLKCLLSKG